VPGAPRIHGELLKLGIHVAERTVSRLIPKRPIPPSQTWRTFLTNHVRDLVSVDFFTVPTARLRVLFVLVVLAHHRRRVWHFNSPATLTVHRVADNHCKLDSAESESLLRSRAGSGDEGERTQARTGAATDLERRHDQ
jgi:putative transposase